MRGRDLERKPLRGRWATGGQNFRKMTVMDFVDYPKQKQVVTATAAVISAWYLYCSKLALPRDLIVVIDLAKAFFYM